MLDHHRPTPEDVPADLPLPSWDWDGTEAGDSLRGDKHDTLNNSSFQALVGLYHRLADSADHQLSLDNDPLADPRIAAPPERVANLLWPVVVDLDIPSVV
jgi:hypothetical protein